MSALSDVENLRLHDIADGDVRDDPRWLALMGEGAVKAFLADMAAKHLPGRHDQSTHGRRRDSLVTSAVTNAVENAVVTATRLADKPKPSRARREPGPRPGRDLTDELMRDSSWVKDAQRANLTGHADAAMSGLVARQPGWTSKGRVVTAEKLDEAVSGGWTEIWRGAKDPHSAVLELTGGKPTGVGRRSIQKDRTGKWDMGHGYYGNGKYFTTRRSTAEVYRGTQQRMGFALSQRDRFGPGPLYEFEPGTYEVREPGALLRSAISPEARLVDYDELKAEHAEFLSSHQLDGALADALNDSSFYAAMRGYDGVRIRGGEGITDGAPYPPGVSGPSEADQYIIFNRSALMFEEASDRYDT